MKIIFRSASSAQSYLDGIKLDMIIRPNANTKTYNNNTLDFSQRDKELLYHLMRRVQIKFHDHCRLDIGTIALILLDRKCYWDFPFTLKDTIIFTPALLDKHHNKVVEILIHEIVHIDQKRNQNKYNNWYPRLGFSRYNIDFGRLGPYLLDNPDGARYEWVWMDKYIPCAILTDNGTFMPLLLRIDQTHGHKIVYKILEMKQVPEYCHRFGPLRQLYHPNEITAHLISDWIGRDIQYAGIDYSEISALLNK